ncbi:MAG: hypothetical protein ACLR3C_04600 [Eggerthella lenta]
MLVQMLYNVIDGIRGTCSRRRRPGRHHGLNPMMTAMVAVAMLVGVGGNALAAIKLGERKKGVAERVMGNSFVLLIATAGLWGTAIFALGPSFAIGRRRLRAALALDF